jgi:hypothetical protein
MGFPFVPVFGFIQQADSIASGQPMTCDPEHSS